MPLPTSPSDVSALLAGVGYICDTALATSVYLAIQMEKALLIEGPPGVGKTELAKACAQAFDCKFLRLQCYEGLDESKALYEWQYTKQLLYTQLMGAKISELLQGTSSLSESANLLAEQEDAFFSDNFLQPRPLLQALLSDTKPVLLIDEIDRSEEEMEAFLLEFLAENQVTIPELGPVHAKQIPLVILTSNASRELSDALRRRCLHLHLDYPEREREIAIIQSRLPHIESKLAEKVVDLVVKLRQLRLRKAPSLSESIDWAQALSSLSWSLNRESFLSTLGVVLKFPSDQELARQKLDELLVPE